MYEAHYGFSEKPFNLTPDPKYLYLSARHHEAFAHLEFGHRERGGFVVITGEVGAGKTTLARYFLGRLGPGTDSAVVLYPALTATELLRSILDDLQAPCEGSSLKDQVDALHRFLLESRRKERNVVLLIDEAQDLSPEVLEQIRLLSNLETDTEKLIQIVLMGQSELHDLLERQELRQLAQRVTARYHLGPLSARETGDYVQHRIAVAGGTGKVFFSPEAIRRVYRRTGGVPRLINLLCDRALLAGYVSNSRSIDAALVRQAATELDAGRPPHGRSLRLAAAGVGVVALIAATVTLWPARGARSDAVAPPPAATPTPGSGLEPLLLTLPAEASLEAARSEVASLWGAGAIEETELRTHLDQVRWLDLPVILEMFHPDRRELCYVALLSMEGSEALLGTGSDVHLRVPLDEVSRLWTRRGVFLWRDFELLDGASGSPRARAWVRGQLQSLGYLEPGGALAEAVARFQRDASLQPDGVVGRLTLMALYSASDVLRPRLGEGPA